MKKILVLLIILSATACVDIDTAGRVESRRQELVDTIIEGYRITVNDSIIYEYPAP